MFCQGCGIEAPTKQVCFYQNIGALVMRFHSGVEGELCKRCIHKHFWKMSLTTLFLGPWGIISLIVTPFFLLNNIFRYLFCLGMEPPAEDARPPRLTDEVIEKLDPFAQEIGERLGDEEPFEQVADDVAGKAGVTPGQLVLYVQALIAAAEEEEE